MKPRIELLAALHAIAGSPQGWQQWDDGVYLNRTMLRTLRLNGLIVETCLRQGSDPRAKCWTITPAGQRVLAAHPIKVSNPHTREEAARRVAAL